MEPRFRWTEDAEAELRELEAKGLTGGQIAKKLGTTRNAVISKLHRIGVWAQSNGERSARRLYGKRPDVPRAERNGGAVIAGIKSKARRERSVAAGANPRVRNAVIARAKALGELPADEPVRPPFESRNRKPVPLLDLQFNHCRWPICDSDDSFLGFCGDDRRDKRAPYCRYHCGIAYRERPNA